jgi:integrase
MPKSTGSRQRRGRGEGSIFPYRGGYRAVLTWIDASGRRRQRTAQAPTAAEARRRLLELRSAAERGELTPTRVTVGDWLRRWLEAIRPQVRPSTWRGYEALVRVHLIPALGRIELRKLAPSDVERLTAAMIEAGNAPRTAAHARVVLRRALADAQRDGLIARNPAALARPPYVATRALVAGRDYLEPADLRRLMTAAMLHPYGPLIVVLASTGLRLGEALGLAWADVDLDAGRLTVRRTLGRTSGGGFGLVEPKTRKSRRTLDLPRVAVTALRRQAELQATWRAEIGAAWTNDEDLVFTDRLGEPLRQWNVHHALRGILAAAGLPPVSVHALRRSCAVALLAGGASLFQVSRQLGHSGVGITEAHYAGLAAELRREAATALDRVLGGEA